MEIHKLKAHEIKELIEKKELKATEVTEAFLSRIDDVDKELHAFLYVARDEAVKSAADVDEKISKGEKLQGLSGIPIAIKDNISVKNMQNTCASKILKDYIAPYDASVSEKLKENGAVILGKLNMDEFAMGSSTENSAFQITKNPWDTKKVPGGSSGGSAVSVAAFESPLSLGTETGGSVRQPASFCGVVGLKPTYGRVSRYGVVAFGSTLDQVGEIGRDVRDCALLTQTIAGLDNKDFTTADVPVQDYLSGINSSIKGKRIAIPVEYFGEGLDENVRKAVLSAVKVFEDNGAIVEKCSLKLSDYALSAYYIISSAEASSNLARFDGIRYGHRSENAKDAIDIYFKSRSEGFGDEAKRRIMLGTYVLSAGYYDAYYKKALKVRKLIKEDFQAVLSKYDAVLCPTSPTTAFNIGEKTKDVMSMYLSDIYTVPVNIAGLPSISVPCGMVNNMPVGLQLIGNYFREDVIFNLACSYEQSTPWHDMCPNI